MYDSKTYHGGYAASHLDDQVVPLRIDLDLLGGADCLRVRILSTWLLRPNPKELSAAHPLLRVPVVAVRDRRQPGSRLLLQHELGGVVCDCRGGGWMYFTYFRLMST